MKRRPDKVEDWVTTRYRVIFGDTDAMGIVYYGNYLRLFEVGRNEYFRACGGTRQDIEEGGVRLVVAELSARYRGSAQYDDAIDIETGLEVVDGVRLRFFYRLKRVGDGQLLVEGWSDHAQVEIATGRPVRLRPRVLAHVKPGSTP